MTSESSIDQRMQRIEQLTQQLERSSDPDALAAAREMVRLVLELHAAGLATMIGSLSKRDDGRAMLDAWTGDELISSLLLLHGLHPQDLEERVAAALERVRPDLHAHGGDVELLSIDDGVVRLRMQGNCDGCPSSAATLKFTIEQAIYAAAPDVAAIEVEGIESPPPGLVQLELSAGTR